MIIRWIAKCFGELRLEHEPDGSVHAYMRLWDRDYKVKYMWIDSNMYDI